MHGDAEHFPAYPAVELDPTGAGDVFAASFLCSLYRHGDPREAVNFANRVAAYSVEAMGVSEFYDSTRKRSDLVKTHPTL
jgi:sugar/nucleoside kinase (ribokinase family)